MKIINNLDTEFKLTGKIILYLLPILAVVGVTIPLIMGQPNLSLLGSYLAIPMFFAPIVYLKYLKNPLTTINSDSRLFLFLIILYNILFSISLILLNIFEIRPFAYYIIISFIATFILFEILLFEISKKKSIIILVQIMMLVLNLVWGVTLKYYYFIGRTDVLGHAWFIDNVIKYGYVTEVFDVYKSFPLWHILVSSLYLILGIDISTYKMMFFLSGIVYSFMIPLIYLVSIRIFNNKKIALVSSLFISLNTEVIFSGMYSLPRSVVSFLEVLLILLLLARNDTKKLLLALIITFIIIVYHTASIPFIVLLLLIIYTFQKYYGVREPTLFTFNYLILTIVMSLGYWIFHAEQLFQMLIKNLIRTSPEGILTKSILFVPLSELFNYLQYALLLFFIIIGVLWVLHSKQFSSFEKLFCIVGLSFVMVTFPGPSLLFNKLAANFNFQRFGEYTFLFISIVGAIGFMGMYYKSRKYIKIFAIILFFFMSFLSISNDFIASDNPLVKRPFYTFFLTEGETFGINKLVNTTEGYLISDYITTRYLTFSQYEPKSNLLEVDTKNMTFLRNNSRDVILIREQEIYKRPFKLFSSKTGEFKYKPDWSASLDYYYLDSPLWNTLSNYNKIYDLGSVVGFN